ncbi:glutaminase A [Angustibacter luteus]|uniref:Glutaminase n=1 Tax=Angustibacter luteus TaxID=658456 RepID=A0ABW1JGY1_9ACTN
MSDTHPARYVSAGRLPERTSVQAIVDEARALFADDDSGRLSAVYPALAEADPSAFGLCVVSASGDVVASGDARSPFTIMSVAKPFVYALVGEAVGIEELRRRVGVNATGLAFNSAHAVERDPSGRTNPMVNPGAIATTALARGGDVEAQWSRLVEGLSRFAGHDLQLDDATLASARASNHRNRALANMLKELGALDGDPGDVVDLYTRQSCLSVSALDIAVMGATLADGGMNPLTGERVVDAETAHATLAVMTIAGLYETSGDWLFDVGMPGKSGIGGGIVTVSPGKGALGTYSPLLDPTGNSVRGQLAAQYLARRLGLDLLASQALT